MMRKNTDEIEKLYQRIVLLHQDVDTIRQPLLNIKSIIDEMKKLLDLPDTIAKDLKKLRTVILALNEITQLLEWVPGQLGSACKAAHNLLSPLVSPTNKGVLDKMIKTTEDMDKMASRIKQYLEKVEPLVNKGLEELNALRGRVISLEEKLAELVEHYKRIPPSADTVACVHEINHALDQLDQSVQEIKNQFNKAIQPLVMVLQTIKNTLDPIADLAQKITQLLKQIDIKPINDLIRQVNQCRKKIEDFRKKVVSKVEAVVKAAFKRFGIDIDAVDKLIRGLIDSVLKPIRKFIDQICDSINGMLEQLTRMIDGMLPVDQLKQIIATLETWRDKLECELDKLAGSTCKSVLKVWRC
ncbi:hypothetical protein [Sedimenticola selenatireducens]|uniref:Uncharacterized protein n=1 Tax=Sedimenticola selenatireducens TaxID=191960 RepID=A0A557S205_9GAMM|nr:hypothetical protein [Sedimenticola selenatireducens]TVO71465.1 hypothetical protein FHP88_14185 [Sedimenticola selenatireducens]TVT66154.1 MAG: hypothetical protein FHK78_02620 [Sedimenticola selenatireducens]